MRRTIALGLLAGLNLLAQVAVQWYAAVALGIGGESDALFVSTTVPQFVYGVLAGSLMNVLVPVFADSEAERLRRDGWTFLWVVALVFVPMCGLLGLSANVWVPWLVPGLAPAHQALAVELTQLQLVGVVALAISAVLTAIHHATERFVFAESVQLIASMLTVLFAWALVDLWGVYAFALALTLRSMLLIPLLLPVIGAPRLPARDAPVVLETWRRIRPLILGTSYYRLGRVLDRVLASMATPGALSLFYLVEQVYNGGAQIMGKAFAAPLVPEIARRAQRREWFAIRSRTTFVIAVVGALCGAFVAVVGIVGAPIIRIGCEFSGYSVEQGTRLWWMLLLLAGMLVAGSCGQVSASSYYALGETRVPTRIGVLGFTLGIALKVTCFALGFLFWPMDGMGPVFGVAVGTSLYYLVTLVLLLKGFGPVLEARAAVAQDETATSLTGVGS